MNKNKAFGVRTVFYQIVCNLSRECYNPAAMRYEQSDIIFLYVGVRGFDGAGVPRIAPVARS